ncbi:FimV/HubP family polar landmark protein [Pinirhizobacter sp.]|jgi:pilus assembly protein FimV|uniref:FimV/HubP family polar landmark protein n=1 Tax=Pinirhizobacter sp. TaxID=2950432 RepID=UPI002F3F566A
MSRPLKLSVALALALASQYAAAQSLGAVQVKSNLDQPLVAEIPLVSQAPGDIKNVQVSLASVEAYARAGIDRSGIPQGVQFAVVTNAKGQSVIRVTTVQPISEPYIDLLLDVKGGGGTSVVREVTLLLDPASAPAPAAAPAPAVVQQAAPAATQAPTPPAARPPVPEHAASAPAAPSPARAPRAPRTTAEGGSSLGTVQKGQTLSTYAKQLSGNGVDMNQALMALKQANPDAFYRDNINALKAGVVLRAPSSQDLSATATAEASSQVRRQNEDWRGMTARKPTSVADAASGNAPSKAAPASAEDRLALVPAKGNQAGNGKVAAAMTSLQQDLARSQETLTSLRQQGEELKSRVDDLENINQKNQRLLTLKDAQIADLQKKLADARKAANLPPAAASAPPPVAAVATPEAAASAPRPAAPAAASTASVAKAGTAGQVLTTTPLVEHAAPAPATVPTAKKPTPAAARPVPVSEEEPWFMQPWVWAVAGGAVIVLLLLAMLGRRRKTAVAVATAPSLADRFGDAPLFDESGIDEEDIDQRELLDELSEHPDDVALHLELVTLYYERRDVEHFEAAAEAMYAHVVDVEQEEWQEAVRMGEDLAPQHPLFSHGASPEVQPSHAAGDDAALEAFDISRYANHETPPGDIPPVPHAPQKVSEYHFNFDLSPPRVAGQSPAPTSFHDDVDLGPHVDEPLPAHEDVHPAHSEPTDLHVADAEEEAANSTWKFDEASVAPVDVYDVGAENFSDDPVDTKLDLARAYLDMGDADGARAMLDEVVAEGTQMQQDVARKMLADLH